MPTRHGGSFSKNPQHVATTQLAWDCFLAAGINARAPRRLTWRCRNDCREHLHGSLLSIVEANKIHIRGTLVPVEEPATPSNSGMRLSPHKQKTARRRSLCSSNRGW
jgi:hypothetical protein